MIGGLLPLTQPQKLRAAWLLIFSLGCVFCVRLMRPEYTSVDTAGGRCPCELCWCVRGFNTFSEPQNHTFRLTLCPRDSELSVCKQTLFTFRFGTNVVTLAHHFVVDLMEVDLTHFLHHVLVLERDEAEPWRGRVCDQKQTAGLHSAANCLQ